MKGRGCNLRPDKRLVPDGSTASGDFVSLSSLGAADSALILKGLPSQFFGLGRTRSRVFGSYRGCRALQVQRQTDGGLNELAV
jgi:hypothetical protein